MDDRIWNHFLKKHLKNNQRVLEYKDTLIFVHDYRQRYNKENYKEIKNYLSFISEVENLTLFKIKKWKIYQ